MSTFTFTDDPSDPCMLCVGCDYGLDDTGTPVELDPNLWRFFGRHRPKTTERTRQHGR